jgi:hypothetical protein
MFIDKMVDRMDTYLPMPMETQLKQCPNEDHFKFEFQIGMCSQRIASGF